MGTPLDLVRTSRLGRALERVQFAMLRLIIAVLMVGITIVVLRVYSILPTDRRPSGTHKTESPKECSIAIFLGSGQSEFPLHRE